MTTTLIVISCFIIGAVFGMWLMDKISIRYKLYEFELQIDDYNALKKENEALKFQVQQFNIAKDVFKSTEK